MSFLNVNGEIEVFDDPSVTTTEIVRDGFLIDYRTLDDRILYKDIYHCHTYFELELVCDGSAVHHFNNQMIDVHSGYVAFMRKADFHTYHVDNANPLTLYCIVFREPHISSDILREALSRRGNIDAFLNEEDFVLIRSLMEMLRKLHKSSAPHFDAVCKSAINIIISTILKNASEDVVSEEINHYVRDALFYIEQHYTELDLSLGRVASALGIGQNYLGQIFGRELKTTYTDYLRDKRLSRAVKLLREKRISNDEVARLCGFSSGAYFIAVFKKQYGMTPKKYIDFCK